MAATNRQLASERRLFTVDASDRGGRRVGCGGGDKASDLYSGWCLRAVRLNGISLVPSGNDDDDEGDGSAGEQCGQTDRQTADVPSAVRSRPVVFYIANGFARHRVTRYDVRRWCPPVAASVVPERGPGKRDTSPRLGESPSCVCRQ